MSEVTVITMIMCDPTGSSFELLHIAVTPPSWGVPSNRCVPSNWKVLSRL